MRGAANGLKRRAPAQAIPHPELRVRRRETLVESTARALIDFIARNRLAGGDRLPSARELIRMAGVSRLPLREALCMLKGMGIRRAPSIADPAPAPAAGGSSRTHAPRP